MFCDEGVYKIAIHIKFLCKEKFKNLIPLMGSYHMNKVLLACIGRYLRGSGADSIFIETELFASGVTEQVLNGSNYARSVKGFFLLGEALLRLQLQEFFMLHNPDGFENELCIAKAMQDSIAEKNYEESKKLYAEYKAFVTKFIMNF